MNQSSHEWAILSHICTCVERICILALYQVHCSPSKYLWRCTWRRESISPVRSVLLSFCEACFCSHNFSFFLCLLVFECILSHRGVPLCSEAKNPTLLLILWTPYQLYRDVLYLKAIRDALCVIISYSLFFVLWLEIKRLSVCAVYQLPRTKSSSHLKKFLSCTLNNGKQASPETSASVAQSTNNWFIEDLQLHSTASGWFYQQGPSVLFRHSSVAYKVNTPTPRHTFIFTDLFFLQSAKAPNLLALSASLR